MITVVGVFYLNLDGLCSLLVISLFIKNFEAIPKGSLLFIMLKNPTNYSPPKLSRSETITTAAVILALTIVLASPIPIPVIGNPLFLIPLLFAATTQRLKMTIFAASSFGVISFLYSMINPGPIALIFFHSPWIPLIPRIGVGFVAFFTFKLFRTLIKPTSRFKRILPFAITGGVGALANTLLVLSWIAVEYLALGRSVSVGIEGLPEIIIFILMIIVPIEFGIGIIATPSIALAYLKVRSRFKKDTGFDIIEDEEDEEKFVKTMHCPDCGAGLTSLSQKNCEFCGVVLTIYSKKNEND